MQYKGISHELDALSARGNMDPGGTTGRGILREA